MENDQYGAKAAELLKQYKAADLKREADGYDQAAQIILGQQDHIMANPLGAAGRVKDAFTKMGHPDWYNPKWDNLGPMELAKEMNDFGKGLAGHNAGLRKAIETAEAKGAAAMQVAKENNRSRESIAAANNETKLAVAKAVQAAKAAGPGGVKTLEALQAQLTQAAMAADDPEKAKALYDQAEFVGQEGAKLKGASAQVTTGAKPAMSPLGIESNADVSRKNPPPQVPRPMPRGAAPAAPAAPVAPPGAALTEPPVTQKGAGAAMPRITDYPPVPTGKVYVFNVKTGKVGAIPEGQLEQAMKSGYDLVH
jgi:hypothetical protein